jgi:hypothetical protein
MSARTLPANATPSVWFRTDTSKIVTDNQTNGSGAYTVYADGAIWDTTNNKYISPDHIGYLAYLSTPQS